MPREDGLDPSEIEKSGSVAKENDLENQKKDIIVAFAANLDETCDLLTHIKSLIDRVADVSGTYAALTELDVKSKIKNLNEGIKEVIARITSAKSGLHSTKPHENDLVEFYSDLNNCLVAVTAAHELVRDSMDDMASGIEEALSNMKKELSGTISDLERVKGKIAVS